MRYAYDGMGWYRDENTWNFIKGEKENVRIMWTTCMHRGHQQRRELHPSKMGFREISSWTSKSSPTFIT